MIGQSKSLFGHSGGQHNGKWKTGLVWSSSGYQGIAWSPLTFPVMFLILTDRQLKSCEPLTARLATLMVWIDCSAWSCWCLTLGTMMHTHSTKSWVLLGYNSPGPYTEAIFLFIIWNLFCLFDFLRIFFVFVNMEPYRSENFKTLLPLQIAAKVFKLNFLNFFLVVLTKLRLGFLKFWVSDCFLTIFF